MLTTTWPTMAGASMGMRSTIMSRLRLRAIKCPSCGAQLAFESAATTVTCEYCQQVSQVVGAPPTQIQVPTPVRPQPTLQVAPRLQILPILLGITGLLLVVGMSSAFLWSKSRAGSAQQARNAPSMNEKPRAPAIQAHAPQAPDTDSDQLKDPFPKKENPQPKSKKSRSPKPNPYDVARVVKPAVTGCFTRDLQSPRFPIWYTSTITLSVQKGSFKQVRVSAKANESDPAKVSFRADRSKTVTAADLEQANASFVSCVKNGIAKIKVPDSSKLAGSSGKVHFNMSYDGVPSGI